MQETWVGFLGQEDPLEKGMATHSNILAWRIPQTAGTGGLQHIGSQKSLTQLSTHTYTLLYIKQISEILLYVHHRELYSISSNNL